MNIPPFPFELDDSCTEWRLRTCDLATDRKSLNCAFKDEDFEERYEPGFEWFGSELVSIPLVAYHS